MKRGDEETESDTGRRERGSIDVMKEKIKPVSHFTSINRPFCPPTGILQSQHFCSLSEYTNPLAMHNVDHLLNIYSIKFLRWM